MEVKEIRLKNDQELAELLLEERVKLFKLRNERALTKKSEKTHLYKMCKKNVARLLTLRSELARSSK